jgi:hypothetical protein
MQNDVGAALLKELRAIAVIPAVIDVKISLSQQVIVISSTRLNEPMSFYEPLCAVVRKCWSNLPPPPVSECDHVIVWMIASANYREDSVDVGPRAIIASLMVTYFYAASATSSAGGREREPL